MPRDAPPSGRPPTPHDAGEMVAMARAFLERKGVEEPRLEADLLVAHALGLDRLGLLVALDRPVGGAEVDRARDLLVRRGRREPVAYITGVREFYARPFRVGPGVLVPRPETELLVDLARDHVREAAGAGGAAGAAGPGGPGGPGGAGCRIVDVGTGSGCLAITLALEIEGARVTAIETSPAALEMARTNAKALGARVDFQLGDGLELGQAGAPWDLVVCNPPYVDPGAAPSLPPEVREHEPPEALFAPAGDPDHWLRALLERVDRWLVPGGALLVELGVDQAQRGRALGTGLGLAVGLHRDLAGADRVLSVVR